MIARAAVLASLMIAGVAHADAAKAAKLLREGQKLEATDPKGAQAKLQQALAESPNDPKIMAELGYAALLAKDYATAETMTRKAIATTNDNKVKAAAQYNLGEILAAKGDKVGAEAAKAEAKRLRSGGPFTPKVIDGPYTSIDKFCATWKKRKDEERDQSKAADACGENEDVTAPALDGHAVKLLIGGWETSQRIHHTWHFVAIQMPTGWFVGKVDEIISAGGTGEGNMALEVGDIKLVDVDTHVRALAIPDHMSVTDTEERSYQVTNTSDELVVCAIGKAGKPACTDAITIGRHRHVADHGNETEGTTWALTPSFPGKGILQLTIDRKLARGTPSESPDPATIGAHPLAFP
jgi:hypothetical protein